MRIAHFTLTELPGTLSIWLAGVALGAALFRRELRGLALPVGLMAAITGTSMLGERYEWSGALQVGLDVAFVALAAACAWRLLVRPRSARA